MAKIILFDIDLTLINSGGAGRKALTAAFENLFERTDRMAEIDFGGRTDRAIFREACERHGVRWSGEGLTAFKARYFDLLSNEIQRPNRGQHIEPGITKLLSTLASNSRVSLGLLTGNWRKSAFIKLDHFGLSRFFSVGAFADDAENRNHLPQAAAEKFTKRLGYAIRPRDVIIVGDTPRDVACAKYFGCTSVAVATGTFSIEELRASQPDYVFSDLSRTDQFLGLLNGTT